MISIPKGWNKPFNHSAFVLGLFVFFNCVGCGEPPVWEVTHPTTGQVTFKGRPIGEVELSFFPEDKSYPDSIRPRAKTKEDGSFVAWTHVQGDGVPAGSYKVTLVHNGVAISKGTIVAKPNDLPIKYTTRDTSDVVIRIAEGGNSLQTIELK